MSCSSCCHAIGHAAKRRATTHTHTLLVLLNGRGGIVCVGVCEVVDFSLPVLRGNGAACVGLENVCCLSCTCVRFLFLVEIDFFKSWAWAEIIGWDDAFTMWR